MSSKSVNPDTYTRAVVDENDQPGILTGSVYMLEHSGSLTNVVLIDGQGETWEICIHPSGRREGTGTAFNPMAMQMANLSRR